MDAEDGKLVKIRFSRARHSYGSHVNHPLLDPLQTQENNSGGGCLAFESTEVELIRALPNFQPLSSRNRRENPF